MTARSAGTTSPQMSPERIPVRDRRLETLLGAHFDDLVPDHIRNLVDVEAEESYFLDFKSALYGNNDDQKRELAKDVVAMANGAGGAIVLGITEDDQARAQSAPGVTVSDDETRRMHQIIASHTAPVPTVHIKTVVEPDRGAGPGFYVLVVPQSPMAPHAVLINHGKTGLRYPRRSGPGTVNLSEPEIAAAYRQRDFGAARQVDRLASVVDETIGRLDLDEPWLLLALVPDMAGYAPITKAAYDTFTAAIHGHPITVVADFGGGIFTRTRVGQRCFLADDAMQTTARHPHRASLQVHEDGSGSFAFRLHDIHRAAPGDQLDKPTVVGDEWLAIGVLSGVHQLGQHARDAAATNGNALVRAQIVTPANGRAVELGWSRGLGFGDRRMLTSTGRPIVADHALAIDDIATPRPATHRRGCASRQRIGSGIRVSGAPPIQRSWRDLHRLLVRIARRIRPRSSGVGRRTWNLADRHRSVRFTPQLPVSRCCDRA